jgi:transcriptional regulator with XRE-family HTH domain
MSPASSSSSTQAARNALADRLQGIRKDAGITGRELSARCGWHPAKTSRIQDAKSAPSEADIRRWCAACGAEGQIADLIAASRAVELMYVEWRRLQHAGLRNLQESYTSLYAQTRVFRCYTSDVVPGVLQTSAYVRAIMSRSADDGHAPDDLERAVAAKLERAGVIRSGNRRFSFVIEEAVLRYRLGDAEAMAGQLGHLLAVMPLPRVSLGVIPFATERSMWPVESFRIFDDQRVQIELVSAAVNVTVPGEIGAYERTFADLQALAVYGASARALITEAMATLG